MTLKISTDKKKVEGQADASSSDALKERQAVAANRRYNPYDGMNPDDPNYVEIPPEEFEEMLRKKKAMGIPSLEILKEKTEKFNKNDDDENESAKDVDETEGHEENIPLPPPSKWSISLRMKSAGVPNEAILQRAKVMGKTPTEADVSELGALLGMEGFAILRSPAMSTASATKDTLDHLPPRSPPQLYKNLVTMQKRGMPKEAALRTLKLLGHDCTELEQWCEKNASSLGTIINPQPYKRFLDMKKKGIPREAILISARCQGEDINEIERILDEDGTDDQKEQQQQTEPRNDPSKVKQYVKMREKGISVKFILEAARNQFLEAAEVDKLEKILADVKPTKSTRDIISKHRSEATASSPGNSGIKTNIANFSVETQDMARSNEWFTPIKATEDKQDGGKEDEDEDKDKETVAFHRGSTSQLASLVRRMVLTVDKESRNRVRRKGSGSYVTDDDLVVNSKTLYQALGSLQGVKIARDNFNETLVTVDENTKKSIADAGWVRAKRQSFREITKSIGVKLPNASDAEPNKRAMIGGLDELVRYIEGRYSNEIQESLTLLREDKLYDFDSLSAMYVPGSRVVAKNICSGGIDMICRVSWNRIKSGKTITGKTTKEFEVCFEFVVAVGTNKATIAEVVEGIGEFQGRRNIFSSTGLIFVPWMAYSEAEQNSLLERYRRRGRIYNEVALNNHRDRASHEEKTSRPSTYSYKAYRKGCFFVKRSGFGGTVNPASASKGMATDGRIVIDAQGAYEYGNSLGVGYDPMITGIHYKLKEYKLHQSRSASEQSQNKSSSDSSYDRSSRSNSKRGYGKYADATRDNNDDNSSEMVLFDSIPDDYLELVWPSVIGFSLTAKAWGDCLVDGLEDIVYSEDVFDRLVLPDNRKRLIKALVKHSSVSKASAHHFQDLIKGKGEGTVFLLYGPPGVGKTLTAEAVAEVLQRPLYSLSMGTLGTTADDLERRLKEILTLSSRWNAIILLDEADSFLEKRSSSSSLERNAMVSVMLQLVEYFTGILFLTSNRMDSLDPAFQTRITLSLPYRELTDDGREKIWENLLDRSGVRMDSDSSSLPSIRTRELAKRPLNGREIKNALRLALALASEEDRPLCHDLLMETSAMVRPVSTFGRSRRETTTADRSPPVEEATPHKPFITREVFLAVLPILFLLAQNGLLMMMLFLRNGGDDDTEDPAVSERRGRRSPFHLFT
eukprot:CAMPEP_0197185796 /NCGR_PEP_ID=MMETSP1423-20130617/12695_1 /TAXON_ID=476441 /ORGANISM="Pseudo-nitzschia heimii, Strain UNC1101" /LENGTH=1194 /DNA_ID=CAMNT_0042636949 /DNA_START=37 /DNA_END=3621 /DNA_ORIENTATION=-